MAQTDIRVLVPRVRRAVEGVAAPQELTDDNLKDLVADALADVLLYTGGVFGKDLLVIQRDATTNAPTEYATSDELTLPEGSVIAAQAALNHYFHEFKALKVSESIADEAQTWDYSLSPNLLRDNLKLLQGARDEALEMVRARGGALESYTSFLAVRDQYTSLYVEPWVEGVGVGGQGDFRFETYDPPAIGPGFY